MESQFCELHASNTLKENLFIPIKAVKSKEKNKTIEKLFDALVDEIRISHRDTITEEEAARLARNFIGFCQKWIEVEIRLDDEREKESKENVN